MPSSTRPNTVDNDEVARFSALADKWWDTSGPMAPLHKLNPLRLGWIKDQVSEAFERDINDPAAYSGLRFLDVGCGAGIVAEPIRRLGAEIVAIDPSSENIEAARVHAAESGLSIDYRVSTAEALAESGDTFDVITALEVVEHVTDVSAFIDSCSSMVKPGGLLIASTINRTAKAFALAIIGAEYVLRWLPRGTHSYDKLVTPMELTSAFNSAGLTVAAKAGVMYVPFADYWRLTNDLDVNYMISATRKPAGA